MACHGQSSSGPVMIVPRQRWGREPVSLSALAFTGRPTTDTPKDTRTARRHLRIGSPRLDCPRSVRTACGCGSSPASCPQNVAEGRRLELRLWLVVGSIVGPATRHTTTQPPQALCMRLVPASLGYIVRFHHLESSLFFIVIAWLGLSAIVPGQAVESRLRTFGAMPSCLIPQRRYNVRSHADLHQDQARGVAIDITRVVHCWPGLSQRMRQRDVTCHSNFVPVMKPPVYLNPMFVKYRSQGFQMLVRDLPRFCRDTSSRALIYPVSKVS
ncbi:hypothetical protein EDB80DRAFT_807846 [Ilyonectria destructans]|nr:hypothetical protein EDB80DRAFT_807846 [Ilyonectria destructans]